MISTRGRYALRVMVDLAEQNADSFVPLNEIADRQHISVKYLELILKTLVQHGLLKGHRGKGGGYRLTRAPEEYRVGEILELTEGTLATVACLAPNAAACPNRSECRTLPMWERFDAMAHDFFFGITLRDLVIEDQCGGGISKGDAHMYRTIYLAGGCFWGCQKYFDLMDGVIETEVGYANGPTENPSYEDVKHDSGHAETVRVVYDPDALPLDQLLSAYFRVIDPTSVNKQGGDAGIQYRTGIYYIDEEDAAVSKAALDALAKQYDKPLAVECMPLENFYPAEEYHQKYLEKNPGGYCHIHF